MVKLLENFLASDGDEIGPFWWEPNTPGVLDIGDISVFLGALIAFSTVFMMVSRWWMRSLRKIIHEEVTQATEPIHPNSNGGLSLADVARKTQRLEKQIDKMDEQMDKLYDQNDSMNETLQEILKNFSKQGSRTPRSSSTNTRNRKTK